MLATLRAARRVYAQGKTGPAPPLRARAGRFMQSWASAVSAVAFAFYRFAQRCPPCPACPSCSCAAVSVALTCSGAASTGAITTAEDASSNAGLWALLALIFAVGIAAGVALERRRFGWRAVRAPSVSLKAKGADAPAFCSASEASESSVIALARGGVALTPSAKRAAAVAARS